MPVSGFAYRIQLDLCKILMPRGATRPARRDLDNAVCRGDTERARGTAGTAGPDHIRHTDHTTHARRSAPAARELPPIRFRSTATSSAAPAWRGTVSTHGPAAARRRRGSSTRYASSMCIGRGPIVALAEREIGIRCIHLRPRARPAVGPSDAAPAAGLRRWALGPLASLVSVPTTRASSRAAYACSFVLVSPFPSGAISVFCAVLLPHTAALALRPVAGHATSEP